MSINKTFDKNRILVEIFDQCETCDTTKEALSQLLSGSDSSSERQKIKEKNDVVRVCVSKQNL